MSHFVLSCATCSLRGFARDEILSTLTYAPQAGFHYWGVAGPPLWDLGGARWFDAAKVRRAATAAGLLGCTEVFAPMFPTTSVADAVDAAADMALLFDTAQTLGAPVVVITGGVRRGDAGLDATIAGFKALLELVRSKGIRIAIEPHPGTQISSRADYDRILTEIDDPLVGVTIDTGHFYSGGIDLQSFIRDYGKRIFNVHFKDQIGRFLTAEEERYSVPLGTGEIDLRRVVELLEEIGYSGALAVELEVSDPQNLPRYCKDAYDYTQKLVYEITGGYAD